MPLYKRTDRLTVCSRYYTPVLHSSKLQQRELTLDVPPFRDPTISDLTINKERGVVRLRMWTKLAVAELLVSINFTLTRTRILIYSDETQLLVTTYTPRIYYKLSDKIDRLRTLFCHIHRV